MTSRTELGTLAGASPEDRGADTLGSYLLHRNRTDQSDRRPAVIHLADLGISAASPAVEGPSGQLALLERDGTPIELMDGNAVEAPPDGYGSWREFTLASVRSKS